jgi:hypothetical protein
MLQADQDYFTKSLDERRTGPYLPANLPPQAREGWIRRTRIQIAKWRGRYPGNKAGEFISDGVKD